MLEPNSLQGIRLRSALSIYSSGGASVVDHVDVKGLDTQVSKKGRGGMLGGLIGSGPAAPTLDKDESRVVITGISEYIDKKTLFMRVQDDPKKSLDIKDYEVNNPTSESDILKFFYGQDVQITDMSPASESPMVVRGMLKFVRGNRVVIASSDGSTNIFHIPRKALISVPKSVEFNVIDPYILATIIGSPSTDTKLKLMYDTAELSYVIGYMFLLQHDSDKMDMIIKATIRNGTSAAFPDAMITLVEKTDVSKPQDMKYRAQQAKPRSLALQPSPSRAISNMPQDGAQEQKTYRFNFRVTLDPFSMRNVTVTEIKGIEQELQYIYEPLRDDTNVFMSLFWAKDKENHPALERLILPFGSASVWKNEKGNGAMRLGETRITQKHAKKNVRMDLGPANMIIGSFEQLGEETNKRAGTMTEKYSIRIKNRKTEKIKVLVRFTFRNTDWKITEDSALQFTVWEPENPYEKRSKSVAKAVAEVLASTEMKFNFDVVFNQ